MTTSAQAGAVEQIDQVEHDLGAVRGKHATAIPDPLPLRQAERGIGLELLVVGVRRPSRRPGAWLAPRRRGRCPRPCEECVLLRHQAPDEKAPVAEHARPEQLRGQIVRCDVWQRAIRWRSGRSPLARAGRACDPSSASSLIAGPMAKADQVRASRSRSRSSRFAPRGARSRRKSPRRAIVGARGALLARAVAPSFLLRDLKIIVRSLGRPVAAEKLAAGAGVYPRMVAPRS